MQHVFAAILIPYLITPIGVALLAYALYRSIDRCDKSDFAITITPITVHSKRVKRYSGQESMLNGTLRIRYPEHCTLDQVNPSNDILGLSTEERRWKTMRYRKLDGI